MKALQQNQSLGEIAAKQAFRIIEGVSIRFVESDPGSSDALLLSPWPQSVFAYEPTWPGLAETTHLVAIDRYRVLAFQHQCHVCAPLKIRLSS